MVSPSANNRTSCDMAVFQIKKGARRAVPTRSRRASRNLASGGGDDGFLALFNALKDGRRCGIENGLIDVSSKFGEVVSEEPDQLCCRRIIFGRVGPGRARIEDV